jgi:hypothetical protein
MTLTTKGDVQGFSNVAARIPIGADNTLLTADAAQALGLKWAALSALLDAVFGSAQGSMIYRAVSTWAALPPGNVNKFLRTMGAGANPAWASGWGSYSGASAGGGGGVTTISCTVDQSLHRGLVGIITVKNVLGGAPTISVTYNADAVATNYDTQRTTSNNTSFTGGRFNDAVIGGLNPTPDAATFIGFILASTDGITRAFWFNASAKTTSLFSQFTIHTWRTPSVNINSITVASSVANALDGNSASSFHTMGAW